MGARGRLARALALAAVAGLLGTARAGRFLKGREASRRLPANATNAVTLATQVSGTSTAAHAGNATAIAAQVPSSPLPKVYFLFLAVGKVSNIGVWNNFFSKAPSGSYRALVHCKTQDCEASLAGSMLEAVPTVPSYYCTDLVSPMNQLLAKAIEKDGEGHPMDKFAFVSDSTLPAKPFSQVYSALVARQGSDFCIFPSREWADIRTNGVLEVAPKHHQWIILNRQHAKESLALWGAGQLHDFMARFRMNMQSYTWMNNTFADSRNFGCLDEFWHMAAIYGPIKQNLDSGEQDVHLPLFVGGPLRVSSSVGWQGTCDTFVVWSKYLYASAGIAMGQSPFEMLHSSLDGPSVPHSGNDQRPGWWDTISSHGIHAIRQSNFLFVRKFIDQPKLSDGSNFEMTYSQVVLS